MFLRLVGGSDVSAALMGNAPKVTGLVIFLLVNCVLGTRFVWTVSMSMTVKIGVTYLS